MGYARADREQAVTMASSSALELLWSVVAVTSAIAAVAGAAPLPLAAVSAIATSFAILAMAGSIAARASSPAEAEAEGDAVRVNVVVALAALAAASFGLAGVLTAWLVPIALLVLAGLLVLDAPVEAMLAAPRGRIAAGIMAIAGIAAVLMLAVAFSVRASAHALIPWAALFIGGAQALGAATVLLRSARRIRG